MSFMALENVFEPPKRICFGPPIASVLKVYPAKPMPEDHLANGYLFRSDGCTRVTSYDPDYCHPGDVKMTPDTFGPFKHAKVNVLQSAFECSAVGEPFEGLKDRAVSAIDRNLWRAVDSTLNEILVDEAIPQGGGTLGPICALSAAQQFLAESSWCGNGIIMGPPSWMNLLATNHVNFEGPLVDSKPFYKDLFGNLLLITVAETDKIYAFDSEVDVFTSEIQVLDEVMPGLRISNDRVVRAELVYTVAIDPCAVGSFAIENCSDLNYLK